MPRISLPIEQWVRAVDELKAAAADPKETNKDEALFWLAHSQNQAHDSAAAVETIRRLERDFPSSPWVKPAQSLRIEIAHRLQRNDHCGTGPCRQLRLLPRRHRCRQLRLLRRPHRCR